MTIEQETIERMRANAILVLNALWHLVRLELRRSSFCAVGVEVVRSLLSDSGTTGDLQTLRALAQAEANASVTLDRPRKRVIFRRLFAIGDVDDFMRASGEVECPTCGYKLYDHPELAGRAKGLRMTCDGKKVKL